MEGSSHPVQTWECKINKGLLRLELVITDTPNAGP